MKLPTLIASAALAVACSGTGAIDPSVDTPSAFARAYCDAIAPCCAAAGVHPTRVSCTDYALIGSNERPFDRDRAYRCITAMNAAKSRPDFCLSFGGIATDLDCARVLAPAPLGRALPGESCSTVNDCTLPSDAFEVDCHVDESTDGGDAGARSGTCVGEMTGNVGDAPCIGDVDAADAVFSWSTLRGASAPSRVYLCDRAHGARCDRDTQGCVATTKDGASCAMSSECDATSYCDATMKCAPRIASGACTSVEQCLSHDCSPTAGCRPATVDSGHIAACGR